MTTALAGRVAKATITDAALHTLIEEAGANASRRAAQLLGIAADTEHGYQDWHRVLVEHARQSPATLVKTAVAVIAAHGEEHLRGGYRQPETYRALLGGLGYEPDDGEFPASDGNVTEVPSDPATRRRHLIARPPGQTKRAPADAGALPCIGSALRERRRAPPPDRPPNITDPPGPTTQPDTDQSDTDQSDTPTQPTNAPPTTPNRNPQPHRHDRNHHHHSDPSLTHEIAETHFSVPQAEPSGSDSGSVRGTPGTRSSVRPE